MQADSEFRVTKLSYSHARRSEVSLPPFDRLLDAFTSFEKALGWPEAQNRIRTVLECGLQRDAGFEKGWPEVLGMLVESGRKGGRDDSQS
jgi:hypothetical protein